MDSKGFNVVEVLIATALLSTGALTALNWSDRMARAKRQTRVTQSQAIELDWVKTLLAVPHQCSRLFKEHSFSTNQKTPVSTQSLEQIRLFSGAELPSGRKVHEIQLGVALPISPAGRFRAYRINLHWNSRRSQPLPQLGPEQKDFAVELLILEDRNEQGKIASCGYSLTDILAWSHQTLCSSTETIVGFDGNGNVKCASAELSHQTSLRCAEGHSIEKLSNGQFECTPIPEPSTPLSTAFDVTVGCAYRDLKPVFKGTHFWPVRRGQNEMGQGWDAARSWIPVPKDAAYLLGKIRVRSAEGPPSSPLARYSQHATGAQAWGSDFAPALEAIASSDLAFRFLLENAGPNHDPSVTAHAWGNIINFSAQLRIGNGGAAVEQTSLNTQYGGYGRGVLGNYPYGSVWYNNQSHPSIPITDAAFDQTYPFAYRLAKGDNKLTINGGIGCPARMHPQGVREIEFNLKFCRDLSPDLTSPCYSTVGAIP